MSLNDINSDDAAARLHAFARLLATPLYVPLAANDPGGDQAVPQLFATDEVKLVLGFLNLQALAMFAGQTTDYAEVSGAELIGPMAETGLGLGLNFGQEDAVQLDAASLTWLAANAALLPPAAPLDPFLPQAEAAADSDAVPAVLRNLRGHRH